MRLIRKHFSELPKGQQKSIIEGFSLYYNADYLTGKYHNNIDAEVVVDENGILYDIRVYDPFNIVPQLECTSHVYINPDGWSNWLYGYCDPAGNDVDEILDEYNGEVQIEK